MELVKNVPSIYRHIHKKWYFIEGFLLSLQASRLWVVESNVYFFIKGFSVSCEQQKHSGSNY